MRQPSKLRYVECELPNEVEKTIVAFEDDFKERLKPFYDRLSDLKLQLPAVVEELDAQIVLREALLTGSPVQSLSSLSALDKSTGLTSPKRDDNDPETIRIDERKLGAAGICLLNGRMFKVGSEGRLIAIRHLWETAGGNYDYFVRLGTAAYTTPEASYNLFQYNPSTPNYLPFVNKGFSFLADTGYKNSQFKHRMIWTTSISASYALKSKMATLGYDSNQINNIFSGKDPNADFDFLGELGSVNALVRATTRLIFLPSDDAVRQPPWLNEANYIELAIIRFLTYRFKKYTTSAVFDKTYWSDFLTELRPKDIKELLENRPEILDVELPQDLAAITLQVEKAIAIPPETSIINTHMNNLPVGFEDEMTLTYALYDLGLAIHNQIKPIDTKRAAQLELVLLELIGKIQLIDFINPPILVNPSDISSLFPSINLPPTANLIALIQSRGDPRVVTSAVAATSAINNFYLVSSKNLKKESNTAAGSTQGFPSVETFAMLLSRRVKWPDNFKDCKLVPVSNPSDQRLATAVDVKKTSSVESNEDWRDHRNNMAYLRARLEDTLASDSLSDIRKAVNDFVDEEDGNKTINKKDTKITSLLSDINSKKKDIKEVASLSVRLLKSIPSETPVNASTTQIYNNLTGFERSAKLAAAYNRNYIEEQGGKKITPGITTQDAKSAAEKAIGTDLPFVGGSDKMLIPFTADVSVDLQVCQTKAMREFDRYLRGLLTPPKWLVELLNLIKHQIIVFQDEIDAFILEVQQNMDAILAKVERLLTLDLNFSGKIGFENSLFKCAWGIDLGLKINLLDLLLQYLDRYLGVVMGPLLTFLGLLGDFLNEIFCIPIQWLGTILNGAAAATAALLEKIGCTVKDFKLPLEIFEILNLINGTFSLRSLVFKKGSADWLRMMGRLKKGQNEFSGLVQFANTCANPNVSAALSALTAATELAISDIPLAETKRFVSNLF